MKLFELTGYKSHPTYKKIRQHFSRDLSKFGDRERRLLLFKDELIDRGFTYHGMGQGGIVFEKEGYPWVFKIFTHDNAYLDFLQFAKQHQGNIHLPKIKGNLINFGNNTYCVRLEKLYNIRRSESSNLIHILKQISEYADFKVLLNNNPDLYQTFITEYPSLFKLLRTLAKKYRQYALDMHGANIMKRDDGTWVITDPLA